jgi:hypothetical protein
MTEERSDSESDQKGPTPPRMRRALAVLNGEELPGSEPTMLESVTLEPTAPPESQPGETGGPKGPEPTRYGDWERKGRCIDF